MISPPIGQEYQRTHWTLRLLANRLSRIGVHVLRFDYRGVGDSYGSPQQVASLNEWQEDLETAIDFLKKRTDCDAVMLLGLRFGAMLSCKVAQDRSDVHSLVAWEPVSNGDLYLRELRAMHQTMIDLWSAPVPMLRDEETEELLGTRYRHELLDEIEVSRLQWERLEVPQLVVHPAAIPEDVGSDSVPWQRRISTDDSLDWGALSKLEIAWLRQKTCHRLAKAIGEMFTRLEHRELLAGAMG
ncbi:MAG: alpha/beta fold hydrolase [Planctomycetota bacterium]